jgi:hypothetical protein
VALRTLARRAHAMLRACDAEGGARSAEGDRRHHPQLATGPLEEFGDGPIVAATVLCAWSHPGGSTLTLCSRCSPAWHPSRPTAVRSPTGIDSAGTATEPQHGSDPVPTNHTRLRRPPHRRRQDRPSDQTLSCPLRRRDLYRLLESGTAAA